MFSPITFSMEERLKLIKNSMSKEIAAKKLAECESLVDFYHYARQVKNGVLSQMQLYVLENYKKLPLEVWNKDNFSINPHTGAEEMRFGKKDVFKYEFTEHVPRLRKIEKERYDESIKITEINFVLDEMDGDFSVKFNNGPWAFLYGKEIVTYYYTVKNYLEDGKK